MEPIQKKTAEFSPFSHPNFSFRSISRTCFLFGLVACLNACTYLPSAGPSSSKIKSDAAKAAKTGDLDGYKLVPITSQVITALRRNEAASSESGLSNLAAPAASNPRLERLFRSKNLGALSTPPRQTIVAGDVLNVTIFEAGGGLFSSAMASGTGTSVGMGVLPPQIVDESGEITVPYAGRVKARGLTAYEVEQEVVSRLKTKAVDPQAIVTVTARVGGNLVTVTGDVATPSRVPIAAGGIRLLDAVTAAGAGAGNGHEITVTVIRGSDARSDTLGEVMANVSKNIPLKAGDTVILKRRSWSFLAFGAAGKTASFPFEGSQLSLAEAMAQAGGATDGRANPSTIYVYRVEATRLIERMGLSPVDPSAPTTRVIYQLDLHSPRGFFLAQEFGIRNKDILYFPNAGSVGLMKFLNLINALTAPARSGLSTASGLDNLGM